MAAMLNTAGTNARSFNVIEEYALLSLNRKLTLFTSYSTMTSAEFEANVKMTWPNISVADMRKLTNFMTLLKKTAH